MQVFTLLCLITIYCFNIDHHIVYYCLSDGSTRIIIITIIIITIIIINTIITIIIIVSIFIILIIIIIIIIIIYIIIIIIIIFIIILIIIIIIIIIIFIIVVIVIITIIIIVVVVVIIIIIITGMIGMLTFPLPAPLKNNIMFVRSGWYSILFYFYIYTCYSKIAATDNNDFIHDLDLYIYRHNVCSSNSEWYRTLFYALDTIVFIIVR